MKHRTTQQREERKRLKSLGKWPKQKAEKLFACERVLADASIAVQDLLMSAMSKPNHNHIMAAIRTKQPYLKLSDAKKRVKSIVPFKQAKGGVRT